MFGLQRSSQWLGRYDEVDKERQARSRCFDIGGSSRHLLRHWAHLVGRQRLLLGHHDRMLLGGQMTSKETPIRTVRVNDKLWHKAKAQAKRDDTTVSEVINQALREFISKKSA